MTLKRTQPIGGVVNVSLTSGDGYEDVEFSPDITFDKPPVVILNFMESLGSGKVGFCAAISVTVDGFRATVDSDSALSDVDIAWTAMPRRRSERASQ